MLEVGVAACLRLSLAVHVLVCAVSSPELGSEVGRGAEGDCGGEHVAYHLHLVAEELERFPETVNLCVERDGGVEVEDIVESVGGILHFSRGLRVPLAPYLGGVHAVVEADGGRDVYVLEELEGG